MTHVILIDKHTKIRIYPNEYFFSEEWYFIFDMTSGQEGGSLKLKSRRAFRGKVIFSKKKKKVKRFLNSFAVQNPQMRGKL